MTIFFGFALADSMFVGDCTISRTVISVHDVQSMIAGGSIVSCLNPSHLATINAMRSRYGINVPIPEKPPQVELRAHDSIIVMGVRGLPRLTDRHEYTEDEVDKATFNFAIYIVS